MTYRSIVASFGLSGLLLLVSPGHAQSRGSGGFLPPSLPAGQSRTVNPGVRSFRGLPAHRAHHRYAYGPYFYPYYPYDYEESSPEPPRGYDLEVEPAPAAGAPSAKPAESMVVELRGDRWVRLTSSGPQEASVRPVQFSDSATATSVAKPLPAFNQAAPAAALPPATLVFRDGHQEQVSKYTIVAGTIYLKADYWTSGSWTRKLRVADLDVPATLKLNHDRGVAFLLPSRPSEVILRP